MWENNCKRGKIFRIDLELIKFFFITIPICLGWETWCPLHTLKIIVGVGKNFERGKIITIPLYLGWETWCPLHTATEYS